MSVREIIDELPRLTTADLLAIEQRISELAAKQGNGNATAAPLHAEQVEGSLVLTGARTIRQAEVEAILDELP